MLVEVKGINERVELYLKMTKGVENGENMNELQQELETMVYQHLEKLHDETIYPTKEELLDGITTKIVNVMSDMSNMPTFVTEFNELQELNTLRQIQQYSVNYSVSELVNFGYWQWRVTQEGQKELKYPLLRESLDLPLDIEINENTVLKEEVEVTIKPL